MSVKMRKGDERIGRYQLSLLCAKPNAYCGLYLASRALNPRDHVLPSGEGLMYDHRYISASFLRSKSTSKLAFSPYPIVIIPPDSSAALRMWLDNTTPRTSIEFLF